MFILSDFGVVLNVKNFIFLNEYNTVKDLRYAIEEYVEFYNQRRWHQSLNYETPAEVYFKQEREACGYVDASFGTCGHAMDNAKPRVDHTR